MLIRGLRQAPLLGLFLCAISITPIRAASADDTGYNGLIVETVNRMPAGGGYKASHDALTSLGLAISFDGHSLRTDARVSSPTFCSAATYLVFLSVVDQLRASGKINLPPDAANALLVNYQPDGTGVWGRWNANGPGTARLFEETHLGTNFTDWQRARPGDFMKIFWNDEIGSKERGHSVIYLGKSPDTDTTPTVTYWSSQAPAGYGKVTIPRSKVHRVIFSRLDHPERIAAAAQLPESDIYLADMLRRPGTEDEMLTMTGVIRNADAQKPAQARIP